MITLEYDNEMNGSQIQLLTNINKSIQFVTVNH